MPKRQWIIAEYDGSNPEDARDAYNEFMKEWEDALRHARDSRADAEVNAWIREADKNFEDAQKIGKAYKAYHQKSVEGDDIEDYELALIPPEEWFSFLTSDKIPPDLYEHLRKHYPWVIPSEPASRPDPSSR